MRSLPPLVVGGAEIPADRCGVLVIGSGAASLAAADRLAALASSASDPTIVVLIMIRKPNRSIAYYGGTVAAPAVREVLRHTLAYMEVPPDKDPTKEPVKSGTVTASD